MRKQLKRLISKKQQLMILFMMVVMLFSISGCSKMPEFNLGKKEESSIDSLSTIEETTATEKSSESESFIEKTTIEETIIEKTTIKKTTKEKATEATTIKETAKVPSKPILSGGSKDIKNLPAYFGVAYAIANNNRPFFEEDELTTSSYEYYGDLDSLGRCSVAIACIGKDMMPTEPRGSIGQVKPTGWQTVKYDSVDGKYLYNRCHLIGFQLTGENANTKNLITGTRYMNVDGMLPFENMIADYIKETGNHVMYRVTPIFEGNNLLATGVLMEAISVEDEGEGIEFNVYCYNVQPDITIDYATGNSQSAEKPVEPTNPPTPKPEAEPTQAPAPKPTQEPAPKPEPKPDPKPVPTQAENVVGAKDYVLNRNSKKFHNPECSSADAIKPSNRLDKKDTRDNIISQGYDPCKRCTP